MCVDARSFVNQQPTLFFPLAAALATCLASADAHGASWRVGTSAGVMTQPASNYYHLVYGGYGEAATEDDWLIIRAHYLERPEFAQAGYVDQDYGWFIHLGTKVTATQNHGLYAYFGGGRMSGWLQEDAADSPEGPGTQRRFYSLPGASAAIEYGVRALGVEASISHQSFVGYVDQAQLQARVGWPFNFFQLDLGYRW